MTLRLVRPLVCFDLETTGLDPKNDRIIEISAIKVSPGPSVESHTKRMNPGVPISREISALIGITNEDVADLPLWDHFAPDVYTFFDGCDLAGFNVEKFDIPLLAAEFRRAKTDGVVTAYHFPADDVRVIDAKKIFAAKEKRDLAAAVRFYCNREITGWHGAEADARNTLDVIMAQGERYGIPDSIEAHVAAGEDWDPTRHVDRDRRFYWKNGEAVFAFGKWAHTSLMSVAAKDPGYIRWMLSGDFGGEVRSILSDALRGRFPTNNI